MENRQLFYFCKKNIKKMRGNFDMKGLSGKLTLVLTFGIIVMNYQAKAQNRGIFIPYSTVGFGLGTSNYYGDMAGFARPLQSTFKMIRWSATGNYTRHFTPRLAARAGFTYGRIAGDDFTMNSAPKYQSNVRLARNLHFRNDLKEFSLVGIFKLTPDNRSYDRRPQLGTYIFAGIAATAHNPKALDTLDGNWVKLQPLHTEGQGNPGYAKPYSLVQFAIPLGFGVRYKINSRLDISAELGFRFTFTDYLDDVSQNYADPALFADNPLALKMSNRAFENFTARKGKDRTEALRKYLAVQNNIPDAQDPFATLQSTGYGSGGGARGNNPTQKDSYMFGIIHINYVLPTQIKCPPLK
jgi:hypothetical protein